MPRNHAEWFYRLNRQGTELLRSASAYRNNEGKRQRCENDFVELLFDDRVMREYIDPCIRRWKRMNFRWGSVIQDTEIEAWFWEGVAKHLSKIKPTPMPLRFIIIKAGTWHIMEQRRKRFAKEIMQHCHTCDYRCGLNVRSKLLQQRKTVINDTPFPESLSTKSYLKTPADDELTGNTVWMCPNCGGIDVETYPRLITAGMDELSEFSVNDTVTRTEDGGLVTDLTHIVEVMRTEISDMILDPISAELLIKKFRQEKLKKGTRDEGLLNLLLGEDKNMCEQCGMLCQGAIQYDQCQNKIAKIAEYWNTSENNVSIRLRILRDKIKQYTDELALQDRMAEVTRALDRVVVT